MKIKEHEISTKIAAKESFTREVKKVSKDRGGVIYVPQRLVGKTVYVIVPTRGKTAEPEQKISSCAELFKCEKCGKPRTYKSRESAERAFDDKEYAKKLGNCICTWEDDRKM